MYKIENENENVNLEKSPDISGSETEVAPSASVEEESSLSEESLLIESTKRMTREEPNIENLKPQSLEEFNNKKMDEILAGVSEDRDKCAIEIITDLVNKKNTWETIELLVGAWNLKNIPPLTEEELSDVLKRGESIYKNFNKKDKPVKSISDIKGLDTDETEVEPSESAAEMPNFDNIPDELKTLRQWVCWKHEEKKSSEGIVKKIRMPYQINGKEADPKNPNTWATFEEVRECADKYDGIGLILSENCGILVVEFRDVKEGDSWNKEALEEIKSLKSYSEIYSSKSDIRIRTFVLAHMNKGRIETDNRAMYVKDMSFSITGNIFGEEISVNEAQETVNSLHIKWFNSTTGVDSTAEDYFYLLNKNVDISTSESTRINNVKKFITDFMMDEEKSFVTDFIEFEMRDSFAFTKTIASKIKSFYREKKKKYDAEKIRQKVISDFDIDPKYNGMYTFYYSNKTDARVKINIHPDKIADYILLENHILTYKDTMFVYRDGFYRPEPESIRDIVVDILNDICKGDNSDKITYKINDIMTQLVTKTRVHAYPFNKYANVFPVENGVIIFDFEAGTCRLEEHDPDEYRFNYKIPVKYDPNINNTVIRDILKEYTTDPLDPEKDNSDSLLQIPAQSFMQAIGNGPYKKAYLICGGKNSGKTTFLNILEVLVGKEGFCNISLAQINQRFQLASLEGKLFNLHDDMEYFKLKESGTLKTLTGQRAQQIERKGVQPYTAMLDAVHVFNTNNPPSFDSRINSDEAFWERWYYITFNNIYEINGNFKNEIFTPENMSGFLNNIVSTMLIIGKSKKLPNGVDWRETREKWVLTGNLLLRMVRELMDNKLTDSEEDRIRAESRSAIMTYIIKEELLRILQDWCHDHNVPEEAIPKSIKGLTELVDICGWDSNEQKYFASGYEKRRCYSIPYKWKNNKTALSYAVRITRVCSSAPVPAESNPVAIDGSDAGLKSDIESKVDIQGVEEALEELSP